MSNGFLPPGGPLTTAQAGPLASRVLLMRSGGARWYEIEETWPTGTRRRNASLDEIARLRSFGVPIPVPDGPL